MDQINMPGHSPLTPMDADILRRTAKWARFLALVGFVTIALVLFAGMFAGRIMSGFMDEQSAMTGMPMNNMIGAMGTMYTVIFIAIALLYFFPLLYLYRFASQALKAVNGAFDGMAFTGSLDSLRRLFTYVGVLTVIVLCFYAIGILFGAVAFMTMRSAGTF